MDSEFMSGRTVASMKDTISSIKSMEKGPIYIQTVVDTLASGPMACSTASVVSSTLNKIKKRKASGSRVKSSNGSQSSELS